MKPRPCAHLVQKAKHVVAIYQVCNHVHWRPAGCLEEALAKLGERNIIHGEDLPDVAFPAAPGRYTDQTCPHLQKLATTQHHVRSVPDVTI